MPSDSSPSAQLRRSRISFLAPDFLQRADFSRNFLCLALVEGVHLDVADAIVHHLVGHRRNVDDIPRDDHLLRFGTASSNHGYVHVRTGLTLKKVVNFRKRHFTRALAFNRFEDVAGLDASLIRWTARNHRNDRSVAEAL